MYIGFLYHFSSLVTLPAGDWYVNGGLRREVDGQDKPDEDTWQLA
jgi:hypothetical protein